MSGSSNLGSFRDGCNVAKLQLLCEVLPPGFVQYCSQQFCVVAVKIFFPIRLVSIHAVHPYSSIDMTAAWKKLHFIFSVRSDFRMTDNVSIDVHTLASHV